VADRARRESPAHRVSEEIMVCQEPMVIQDRKESEVFQETQDSMVTLDQTEHPDKEEKLDQLENRVLRDPQVKDSQDHRETQVTMDCQDKKVNEVSMAVWA